MPLDYQKEFESLIETVSMESASDLHLSVGRYPTIRVSGFLTPLEQKTFDQGRHARYTNVILSPDDRSLFNRNKEIDFSYEYTDKGRFRGNGYFQQGVAASLFVSFLTTFAILKSSICRRFWRRFATSAKDSSLSSVRRPRQDDDPCRDR